GWARHRDPADGGADLAGAAASGHGDHRADVCGAAGRTAVAAARRYGGGAAGGRGRWAGRVGSLLRHCEEPKATKQSRVPPTTLDCFAAVQPGDIAYTCSGT